MFLRLEDFLNGGLVILNCMYDICKMSSQFVCWQVIFTLRKFYFQSWSDSKLLKTKYNKLALIFVETLPQKFPNTLITRRSKVAIYFVTTTVGGFYVYCICLVHTKAPVFFLCHYNLCSKDYKKIFSRNMNISLGK